MEFVLPDIPLRLDNRRGWISQSPLTHRTFTGGKEHWQSCIGVFAGLQADRHNDRSPVRVERVGFCFLFYFLRQQVHLHDEITCFVNKPKV